MGLLGVELTYVCDAGFQLPLWKFDEDLYNVAGGG